ncbi:hypothetical protein [Oceanobacillus jeddahense]|uniref:AI-2E family transporter n=1 Tax=Oceanobacillus jeddahense TaxID=1462527 RepID=A0ABY5JMD4_9BACI|nr:hypothetical protein [Oceanobacillus jeddahense]UUI01291.1 hypothetical protein NP439_14610 [Oceanobacillus jeddahense]
MTDILKKKRWLYLPIIIISFILGLFYLTKVADYLTLPFLSLLLLILTFLEVYPSKNYFSKGNLIKMISALLVIALALWYQIAVFILG